MSLYHHLARQGGAARRAGRLGLRPHRAARRRTSPWRDAMADAGRLRAGRAGRATRGRWACSSRAATPARRCSATTTPCSAACARAGFSVVLAAHAFSVLDAYVYGFVLTELNLPMEAGEGAEGFVDGLGPAADDYPHLVEMIAEQVLGRRLLLRRRVRLRPRPDPRRAGGAAGPDGRRRRLGSARDPPHPLLPPRPPVRLRRGAGVPRRGAALAAIPGVQRFERLRQTSTRNDFSFGVSMEFADQAAYDGYVRTRCTGRSSRSGGSPRSTTSSSSTTSRWGEPAPRAARVGSPAWTPAPRRREGTPAATGTTPTPATPAGAPPPAFPGAGERVGEDERRAALEAEPAGNATTADMVDTDAVDSRAHEQPADEAVEDDD